MYAGIQYDHVASIQHQDTFVEDARYAKGKEWKGDLWFPLVNLLTILPILPLLQPASFIFQIPTGICPCGDVASQGRQVPMLGCHQCFAGFQCVPVLSIYPLNIKYIFVLWIHHTDINLVLSDSEHPFPVLSESCSVFFCFANWVESTSSRVFGVRYKFCKLI